MIMEWTLNSPIRHKWFRRLPLVIWINKNLKNSKLWVDQLPLEHMALTVICRISLAASLIKEHQRVQVKETCIERRHLRPLSRFQTLVRMLWPTTSLGLTKKDVYLPGIMNNQWLRSKTKREHMTHRWTFYHHTISQTQSRITEATSRACTLITVLGPL